jgi:hypothetical protein
MVACAERLGCADRFANLDALIEANGAIRQRGAPVEMAARERSRAGFVIAFLQADIGDRSAPALCVRPFGAEPGPSDEIAAVGGIES